MTSMKQIIQKAKSRKGNLKAVVRQLNGRFKRARKNIHASVISGQIDIYDNKTDRNFKAQNSYQAHKIADQLLGKE